MIHRVGITVRYFDWKVGTGLEGKFCLKHFFLGRGTIYLNSSRNFGLEGFQIDAV